MKRLLLCISVGIISALVLIQIYTWCIQPEILYYKNAHRISSQHEKKLRESGRPCYIVTGGSETKSSIIPTIMMEEAGIPVVNVATAAGFGLSVNSAIAINHLQPGDTLVLGLLNVLDNNLHPTENGIKLSVQLFGTSAFRYNLIPLNIQNILSFFSSDAGGALASLTRMLTRGYSYVYLKEASIHPDGWMEIHRSTMKNASVPKTIEKDIQISSAYTQFFQKVQTACKQIQADFIVMLPATLTNEYETKRRLIQALQLTRMGIPVLRDERLGLEPNNSLYADMRLHMNAKGAEQNSRIIARLIKNKSYWTEEELLERMKARGFTEDDTPQK